MNDENIFLVLACHGSRQEDGAQRGHPSADRQAENRCSAQERRRSPSRRRPLRAAAGGRAAPAITGPVTTRCTVEENGARRGLSSVTVEPVTEQAGSGSGGGGSVAAPCRSAARTCSRTFAGSVEVVDIMVKVGDTVAEGSVVAAVEAMKAKHDIKAPCDGTVTAIHVEIGDEIDAAKPIMTIA